MAPPADDPEPCDEVPSCPICGGKMEKVYERGKLQVCVCIDCFTSLSIPSEAWDVARKKRQEPPRP